MTGKFVSRALLSAAAVILALIGSITIATPATASTPDGGPSYTKLSDGTDKISYNGHTYYCNYGDLCIYRSDSAGYATYYICQTFYNVNESIGWAVNNQYGSGGTAYFGGRNGAGSFTMPTQRSYGIGWYWVGKVTTCT